MTLKQAQKDARHAHVALEKKVVEVRQLKAQVKKLTEQAERAEVLEAAIRRHHTYVVEKNDWSADDALWAVLGLEWDREGDILDDLAAAA